LRGQLFTDKCGALQVLLGYLPRNREDWATELAKKRATYVVFRDEMIINPVSPDHQIIETLPINKFYQFLFTFHFTAGR
jgi:hypothetical protein